MHWYIFGDRDHQSLDGLVRGKELELEQAAEAYRNLQWLKQQSDEKERNSLREKDTIITQLQAALQTRSQEAQVHTDIYSRFLFQLFSVVCDVNVQSFEKPSHVDKPVSPVSY